MADTRRLRLPALSTRHIRNASSNTVESDSSDSSPAPDDDAEGFTLHADDSESSIGALTVLRDCDMDNDVEQAHRKSPISKLPPELLITIFSKLTTTGDLRNCLLVSYHWALYAVAILWHRPLCSKWSNLTNVARTLADERPTFPYHEMVKRLNLSSIADKVSDGTVHAFINCKAIERLTLTNCSKLTDSGVEGLVDGAKRLQALDVTDLEALTDRSLHRVAQNCPKLQGLNITNCSSISDDSLLSIAHSCVQLKRLKLNGVSRVTDEAIIAVAQNCRSILEIDLAGCHSIGSTSVTALLTNLPQLRELRLAHCIGIDDHAFTDLRSNLKFEALRILDLTACEGVRDDAIARIIPAAPRLRNLVLAKCKFITDQAVKAICTLTKNLHYIHLGHCTFLSDNAVIELVQQCNRIRYIDLACCSRLTDASVRHLARLPKLRRIGLVKCQNLTDVSIMALARGPHTSSSQKSGMPTQFVSLERVHLSYCVNLTLKGITQLLLNCPRLTHLSLTGVQAFLRDDLTKFCREAPQDFTHPQRDVFCVFSGEGVARLREHLAYLDVQERQTQQQAIEEERVYGPDSPDAESMSDGTIDGNEQAMDFIYHPQRSGIPHAATTRGRQRPRSEHDLPSFHVDMPLIPIEQMQRMGPWTPNGPLTPELRATQAQQHGFVIPPTFPMLQQEPTSSRTRSPLPTPNLLGTRGNETPRSRSRSRRHTLETSDTYFAPQTPGSYTFPESSTRATLNTPILSHALPPLAQLGATPSPLHLPLRADLRSNFNVSTYEVNHEAIMSTIPGSRGPSQPPSRSDSPHNAGASNRARLTSFFGSVGFNSPFRTQETTSGRRQQGSASRDASRRREEDRRNMIAAALGRDASTSAGLNPHLHADLSNRHVEHPLLPPELMEQVSMTSTSPLDTPPPPQPQASRNEPQDQGLNQHDVHMTQ